MHTQALSRSIYRDTIVRQRAPKSLQDREAELAELRSFCTTPVGGSYVWWQAPAWSGKTALVSWFVLNPPPKVRIVSFFITARHRGHADRVGFLEYVLGQLSDVLAEPTPAITEASGEVEFLDRLARAAQACTDRGERLILVVDGLDEDRGVEVNPQAYSIAALLPEVPPSGLRVIVTGRPNPPVPDDVPATHPLRHASAVRMLAVSPHAMSVQVDMRAEVKKLLYGTPIERQLLGLVTAAGGGLSGSDLAEITGTPLDFVQEHLHTVSGRSFLKQPASWRAGSHLDVYLLAHEEIQVEAATRLGDATLRAHHEQLHVWAESYRARGWPMETPEYLLRGYSRLLRETGDLTRMLAICTDSVRHDQMFAVSGGDFSALAEIAAVQDMLQTQSPGDLASLGRVAVHRLRITNRAQSIRVNLPHVWARLGHPVRAETLALSMPDKDRRAWALAGVARAVADGGQTEEALRITDSITEPQWRAYALAGAARALAIRGHTERARHLAQLVEETAERPEERAAVLEVYALCGDADGASRILHDSSPTGNKAWGLAGAVAAAGDLVHARDLANANGEPRQATYALIGIAQALAASGKHCEAKKYANQADERAQAIGSSVTRAFALAPLVAVLFSIGEQEQAARLTLTIEELITTADPPSYRAYAWAELAKAVAATGDLDRAGKYAQRAEQTTMSEVGMDPELAAIVQPLLDNGEPGLALRAAQQIREPFWKTWALVKLIAFSPETTITQAKLAASSIAEPRTRLAALGGVAEAALDSGDTATARSIMEETVQLSHDLDDAFYPAIVLGPALRLAAHLGDPGRVVELANLAEERVSRSSPSLRALALAPVLKALLLCGERRLAREMQQRLEQLAMASGDGYDADIARAYMVQELADADRDFAAEIARRIQDWRFLMYRDSVLPVVLANDFDRAESAARAIDDYQATIFLAQLADAAAAAGDSQRALKLINDVAQELPINVDLWDGIAHIVLIGAALRLNESALAAGIATMIRDQDIRVWAIALSAKDPAQRHAAVAAALRVSGLKPAWQPIMAPYDERPPELQTDLVVKPAHILAETSPAALKALAEELLSVTGR